MYSSSFPGCAKEDSSQNSEKVRIILCGGGVISGAISYYLTLLSQELKKPVEVLVVERTSIACSSSGKAGGFLAMDWCKGLPIEELSRKSFSLHADLAVSLKGSERYGYRKVDTLEILADDDLAVESSCDPSLLSWLNPKTIHNLKTIGTSLTTAQVDSYLFTTTLFNEAEARGAKIIQGEVVGFSMNPQNPKVVNGVKLADGRVVECDHAVIAMGAWSASLNSWFKYEAPQKRDIIELPITGSRAHSVIFKPPQEILANNPVSAHAIFAKAIFKGSAKELELYPRSNGQLYVCGEGDGVALPYSADMIEPNFLSTKSLIQVAKSLVPILSDYDVIKEQACYLPYSETGSPLIGHLPFFENLIIATGHSCWGILNAPATGLSIAQLILTGHSSLVDLAPFRLN